MPFREIVPEGNYSIEKRIYAPTDPQREKIVKVIPVDKKGTARWEPGPDGQTFLVTALSENFGSAYVDKRVFPTRETFSPMQRVVPMNMPAGRRVEVFWQSTSGKFEPSDVWTLITKSVLDPVAPAAQVGDGLEQKSLAELQTIVGLESVKDAGGKALDYANMEPPQLIEHIRNHRATKKRKR